MDTSYRQFFAFTKEPFGADIPRKDIMMTKSLAATQERIHYALRLGAIALVTGEIGSGKSTTLRYVLGGLHPSEYKVISVTATSGSILELYRQILGEMGSEIAGSSRAIMTKAIKQEILDLTLGKKMKVALVIDEASLLRLEVFAELHTLTQFEQDSKPWFPIVLAGRQIWSRTSATAHLCPWQPESWPEVISREAIRKPWLHICSIILP
jgi:type II secretory pathway predicted ATPase ExeA